MPKGQQPPVCGVCFNPWPCPWFQLEATKKLLDAEVLKRQEAERGRREWHADAIERANEVQRLTRERDLWKEYAELLGKAEDASAGFLHVHGQSVAPELVAEGQRLRDAIAAAALDREGEG